MLFRCRRVWLCEPFFRYGTPKTRVAREGSLGCGVSVAARLTGLALGVLPRWSGSKNRRRRVGVREFGDRGAPVSVYCRFGTVVNLTWFCALLNVGVGCDRVKRFGLRALERARPGATNESRFRSEFFYSLGRYEWLFKNRRTVAPLAKTSVLQKWFSARICLNDDRGDGGECGGYDVRRNRYSMTMDFEWDVRCTRRW